MKTSTTLRLSLHLFSLCWLNLVYSDSIMELGTNKHWEAINCSQYSAVNDIFGFIRNAVATEQREVFLSLNSDWMSSFLRDNTGVEVTCVKDMVTLLSIPSNEMESMKEPASQREEVLNVLFISVPGSKGVTEREVFDEIDTFLLKNPCWTILREPVYPEGEDTTNSNLYPDYIIFVRLPFFPYAPTCKFFTSITKRQFPQKCPDVNENFYYHMSHYGFGGEANKVVKTFNYMLSASNQQIYTQPNVNNFEAWLWASRNTCKNETFNNDPWACNMLSFSGCSHGDRKETSSGSLWGNYDYSSRDGQHATLDALNINFDMLKTYGDGDGLREGAASVMRAWVTVRLYVLLLRPNARSRYFIRLALKRIHHLGVRAHHMQLSSSSLTVASSAAGAALTSTGPSLAAAAAAPGTLPYPCFGIHVRNGDVMTDFRNERPFDRSLNAHVYAAVNISKALGIYDIYLATDNSTLLHIAPLEYPGYRWYAQRRKMSNSLQRATHLYEDDPQRELANILADAIAIGKCSALVGQGDGSITFFYHVYQCNLAPHSLCPTFFDLQRTANKGKMPYIGRRFDASTYADFLFPFKSENARKTR